MEQPRRYWLVVTEERSGKPEVDAILELAAERGVAVELRVATREDDGEKFAREAVAAGCNAVIAAGGDGTVNTVLNGLVGSNVPLGIIPMGTANDFARQAGISEDSREAFALILDSEAATMDTVSLNGRHFLNVSSGGIGAETTAETSDDLKAVVGPLAYAITGVRKLTQLEPMKLSIDAPERHFECEALLFAVGNARTTGGGNALTPNASVTDGLLDVCIVDAMPVASLLGLLLKLRAGEHVGEEGVRYFQVPRVTIVSSRPLSVNVDGEPLSESRLEYRAHAGSVNVHVNRGQADSLFSGEAHQDHLQEQQ